MSTLLTPGPATTATFLRPLLQGNGQKHHRTVAKAYGIGAGMARCKQHHSARKTSGPGAESARKSRRNPAGLPAKGLWLFGLHAVNAALRNPARVCHRLLVNSRAEGTIRHVLASAGRPDMVPEITSREQIGRILPEGVVHQGIALHTAPLPALHVKDLLKRTAPGSPNTIAVLDQGTDPRNVGAVLRSAAAFGIDAVIVQDRHAPDVTGVLAKAASGALESVALVRATNLGRALQQLKDAGYWTVGLAGDAALSLTDLDWPDRIVIVLGGEDKGLRRLTRTHCDFLVKIPMYPGMESLNLSSAAAIAFFEAYRMRPAGAGV